MFDWILDLFAGEWWTYPLIVAVIIFDAVVPILPSETALITGGVLAARDALSLTGVIVAGTIGAFLGDTLAYTIAARPGQTLRDKLFRSDKARERLRWARDQLDKRPWIVGVARFVPGGRTATMFAAGSLGMPRGRFWLYVVPGGLAWSVVNALLGFLFGNLFRDSLWLALAVSLAIAALLSVAAELLRRSHLSD